MPIWRALVAGILVVGLGAGLVYVLVTGDAAQQTTPTLVTATSRTTDPGATVTVAAPSSTMSSTTRAPILTSTSVTSPPVLVAMEGALDAWGLFAVTGRMRDLGEWFVSGGPQRRQLRAEAEAIRAAPLGLPAYEVTTGDVFTVSVTPTDVVLRAEITWTRTGVATMSYLWDIQMQHLEGAWQLLTIEDVDTDSSS